MNKKAQELSISTIIIAAIAVIILVVVVAIFTGRLGIFTSSLGGSGLEKSKDATMYSCIPLDRFYQEIETTQVAYNKDKSNTAAKTAYDDALVAKNRALQGCSNEAASKTKSGCITSAECQWVGTQ